MNWPLLWHALQNVIFWFFLFYGLLVGTSAFERATLWQTKWAAVFMFIVCLAILARAINVL